MSFLILLISLLTLTSCQALNEQQNPSDYPEEKESSHDETDEADTETVEQSEIEFLPQEIEQEDGLSTANDPFLEETERFTHAFVGDNEASQAELEFLYTGQVMEASDSNDFRAIFVLLNRKEETASDFSLTFSFGENADSLLIEESTLELESNRFGRLEPNSARPVYVEIDSNYQNQLEALSSDEAFVEVHSVDSIDSTQEN